ncbi:MAG: ORF6N domain-containing protein [Epsilonproteobacteria bacterium]|nr:ORF6N domain-containing protein [Campylobacterota bacterium]OIO13291.1 MAG: DNA-binding protein [Helicobacteraceae bacterium CG1_02_36_14]PIP11043.1 MAG: DNA-binding protein [Sulfurimonas sp. CG23_combo_of_CG06-09_8_20_14_all_36_33]PIS25428.1 MAG: DNA-binding protein [Sulfurimonas sp. CG08_land_8_20_14_0_20_36_33]PIU36121.1 MAG: DNA-binding protein [Sulfurimonas sp. CG07_land_8_20_14_0_80_36_56]PIV02420.1 MAG: DNA-binding protein [Sulfurimonas sp. CG03_land_8_20_14_0_80_36_25]PIV35261.1 MA
MHKISVINEENIKDKIFTIRGMQVMLDRDLAELYEVETKVLNQAVKRNENRFPDDFRFQLSEAEYQNLRSQIVTSSEQNSLRSQSVTLESNRGKHTKYLPYAFTEQGVSMLSAVLKSDIAVEISVKIIRSFVNMRKLISNNALVFQRLETLEQKQFTNDEKFNKLFEAIEAKSLKPTQGIFYDGEIYDAYLFVSNLIKSAKESIVLVDNYIDESVLTMLCKREQNVSATLYTKNITAQLELDIKKHNAQYPKITLKKFDASHDRFLILDGKELYHIGASLKDLGKKWFAFSKFEMESFDILKRLEGK